MRSSACWPPAAAKVLEPLVVQSGRQERQALADEDEGATHMRGPVLEPFVLALVLERVVQHEARLSEALDPKVGWLHGKVQRVGYLDARALFGGQPWQVGARLVATIRDFEEEERTSDPSELRDGRLHLLGRQMLQDIRRQDSVEGAIRTRQRQHGCGGKARGDASRSAVWQWPRRPGGCIPPKHLSGQPVGVERVGRTHWALLFTRSLLRAVEPGSSCLSNGNVGHVDPRCS